MKKRFNGAADPLVEAFGYDGGWTFQRRVETKAEELIFKRIVRRLQWRKFAAKKWRTMSAEAKAAVVEYRKQWARDHPDVMRESSRAAKRRRRAKPKIRNAENAKRRAQRAKETQRRRAELVYTCAVCGVQWCQLGRIPAVAPRYCAQSCKSKASYQRGKAAGKAWALRKKAL